MTTTPGPIPLMTVLLCVDCVKACGMKYADQIGGTFMIEPCQLCGKPAFLHEHRTKISIEAIRDDAQ